jgi:hypothetical protein
MKMIPLLLFLLVTSCADAKEARYTGSTPAGTAVRSFLGISLSDSVDFIRWNLVVSNENYSLQCNYGIGRPNTNGFIDKKTIDISGRMGSANNYYFLQNGNKILVIAVLNSQLLHLADENKNLLRGTAGWSYTLSMEKGIKVAIAFNARQIPVKDSATFDGRTPCMPSSFVSENCYKLKWSIVLFASKDGETGTYRLRGTLFRSAAKTGDWKKILVNDHIIYQLNLGEKDTLYLISPDKNILLFTDPEGKLLVGNEDFSYTLNRKG